MTTTTKSKTSAQAIVSLFNLGCSSCSAIIERELKKLPGIEDAVVNYVTDTASVNYDPTQVSVEDIRTFMRKLGTTHRGEDRRMELLVLPS